MKVEMFEKKDKNMKNLHHVDFSLGYAVSELDTDKPIID